MVDVVVDEPSADVGAAPSVDVKSYPSSCSLRYDLSYPDLHWFHNRHPAVLVSLTPKNLNNVGAPVSSS